jgi:hypothetical protein
MLKLGKKKLFIAMASIAVELSNEGFTESEVNVVMRTVRECLAGANSLKSKDIPEVMGHIENAGLSFEQFKKGGKDE